MGTASEYKIGPFLYLRERQFLPTNIQGIDQDGNRGSHYNGTHTNDPFLMVFTHPSIRPISATKPRQLGPKSLKRLPAEADFALAAKEFGHYLRPVVTLTALSELSFRFQPSYWSR